MPANCRRRLPRIDAPRRRSGGGERGVHQAVPDPRAARLGPDADRDDFGLAGDGAKEDEAQGMFAQGLFTRGCSPGEFVAFAGARGPAARKASAPGMASRLARAGASQRSSKQAAWSSASKVRSKGPAGRIAMGAGPACFAHGPAFAHGKVTSGARR